MGLLCGVGVVLQRPAARGQGPLQLCLLSHGELATHTNHLALGASGLDVDRAVSRLEQALKGPPLSGKRRLQLCDRQIGGVAGFMRLACCLDSGGECAGPVADPLLEARSYTLDDCSFLQGGTVRSRGSSVVHV